MKHRRSRLLINILVIVACLLSGLPWGTVSPAEARHHRGDYAPPGTLHLWGCVTLTGSQTCVTGARVTVERHDTTVSDCTYLGQSAPAICPASQISKTVETFPYYLIEFSQLVSDAMRQGVLVAPATLTMTVSYTDPASLLPYEETAPFTVQPEDIDMFGERRVDVMLSTRGHDSYGRPPAAPDWQLAGSSTLKEGSLRLWDIDLPTFVVGACLNLIGDATVAGEALRLTPRGTEYQRGAAWYVNQQMVSEGFETAFRFRINDVGEGGADGFAFVIQNQTETALGGSGGSMAYGFIPNSLAVEFDTWQNQEIGDLNDNHISVQTRGPELNDSNQHYSLGTATAIPNLSDGQIHTATIRYTPGTLVVFLDNLETPTLTVPLNLAARLELNQGRAWVGLTGATGGSWETHDILSWQFAGRRTAGSLEANSQQATAGGDWAEADRLEAARDELEGLAPMASSQAVYETTGLPAWGPSAEAARWRAGVISRGITGAPPLGEEAEPRSVAEASNHWAASDRPGATLVVSTQADAGPGSLRQALLNALPNDTIKFDTTVFRPTTPATITLASELPALSQGYLSIDGSDAGVVLDGVALTGGTGLRITSDGNVIKGLSIVRFPWHGIEITNEARDNRIGGDATTGTARRGEGNIITQNGIHGIDINGAGTMSNTVSGNLIGLRPGETRDLRVQTMAISPAYPQDRMLFIGTRYDGIWKTTDAGNGWVQASSGLTSTNVLALIASPNYSSDRTLYAGTSGGGIFKTTNSGSNWTRMGLPAPANQKIASLAISPNYASDGYVFAVSDPAGLLVSSDRGATWVQRNTGMENDYWALRGVAVSPNYSADGTLFAFTWDRIFRSTNRGLTWTLVSSSVNDINALVISPGYGADKKVIALLSRCSPDQALWQSNDGGNTWGLTGAAPEICTLRALALSPTYAVDRTLFAGGDWEGVLKSTDGGAHWAKVYPGRLSRTLAISPNYGQDQTVFVGQNTGEMARSTNGGGAWTTVGIDLSQSGNHNHGVQISNGAQRNVIGGGSPGTRNIISHNGLNGVAILDSTTRDNRIIGNYIGTDISGTAPLGNAGEGVIIQRGAQFNAVGGSGVGEGNVISANAMRGVDLWDSGVTSNTVQGNHIGVDATGLRALGNDGLGVVISNGASYNRVGGVSPAERNVISGNGDTGVGFWDNGTVYNTVSGNYIGVAADGVTALGNYGNGMILAGQAQRNRVGGLTAGERNVIAGNRGHGMYVGETGTGYNVIVGNYVGLDAAGTMAVPNLCSGITLDRKTQNNQVGGTTAGERNIIAGNTWDGVSIWGSGTSGNTIIGNYIGMNAAGNAPLANLGAGVAIRDGAQDNRVGGAGSGERNIIGGNLYEGVGLSRADTTNNTVVGNYVGATPDGMTALPNQGSGIVLTDGAQGNRIGGGAAGERNVISGNQQHGVALWNPGTTRNVIAGNYIGVDASGSHALGNGMVGVLLDQGAQANRIGGATPGERNVISGQRWDGVSIWKSTTMSNTVAGNYIGTDAAGMIALGNRGHGVGIGDGARLNTIGGTTPAERNVISGNNDTGVAVLHSNTMSNTIAYNYIGITANGMAALGNRWGISCVAGAHSLTIKNNVIGSNEYHGIHMDGCDRSTISGNIIGADPTGALHLGNGVHGINLYDAARQNVIGPDNVIAYNGGRGISVWDAGSALNTITHNSIHSNQAQGIAIGEGGNADLRAPSLIQIVGNSVSGTGPVAYSRIEIFSDNGWQGRYYEGVTVADERGRFTYSQPAGFRGPYLTAAATDGNGNTSALAPPLATLPPVSPATVSISGPANPRADTHVAFTATVSPVGATLPITYTWSAPGQPSVVHVGAASDTCAFTWDSPASGQVMVTVSNGWGVTTGTRAVEVQPTAAMTTTGSATSLAIAPASLQAWTQYTLTARIPAGTTMRASVLAADSQPLEWLSNLPLVDGANAIILRSVDPAVYAGLKLRLDIVSHAPGHTPELLDWRLSWESLATPLYQVAGYVYDGHGGALAGASVALLRADATLTETTTDDEGAYAISSIPAQAGEAYQVRVYLQQKVAGETVFQVRYAVTDTFGGPVVYLQTPPFSFDVSSMFITHLANFDFQAHQRSYQNNVTDHPDRLDDLAAIYYGTAQAVKLCRQLGATLRPLDVDVYAGSISAAYYDSAHSAVVIGEAYARYSNGNRPMNREWHEVFHALMADSLQMPPETCSPWWNHGGWANCSTSDSWAEGWAEFWATVLADRLGWPEPEIYQMGDDRSKGGVSLEYNWRVWDRACERLWCPSREEFAVASLLRDIYDPLQPAEDDYVTTDAETMWQVLGHPTSSNPLRDMRDVYEALISAGIGQQSNRVRACSLNDLAALFVEHGFYKDLNNNQSHECNEAVGYAADSKRPGRRDAPLVEAYLSAGFSNLPSSPEVTITVTTSLDGAPYMDYTYSQVVTRTTDNLIYIEPPPTRTLATVSVAAQAGAYHSKELLTFTNADYWEWVASAAMSGTVVVTYTPPMIHEPPVLTGVSPLALTNDAAHDLSITLDEAYTSTRVWLGALQLPAVTRVNSNTVQARVPMGLTPNSYAVRVANPRTAIATYTSPVLINDPPNARNVLRLTHGAGNPDGLVNIYVDTETRDSVEGLQVNLSYPADRLQFIEPPVLSYRSNYLHFTHRLQEPGTLVLLWLTDEATGLPPGRGPLARLTFRVKDQAPSDQPIPIGYDLVKFSDRYGGTLPSTSLPSEIDVCTDCRDGIEVGDATGDGSVDILDYRRVVSEILGDVAPHSAEQIAADANDDGSINVLDTIRIVQLILGRNPHPARAAQAMVSPTVTLTVPMMPAAQGGAIRVALRLTNPMPVAGLEVRLNFNTTMTLTDIAQTSRSSQLELSEAMGAPGVAQFILSSLGQQTIAAGDGAVVDLVFAAPPGVIASPPQITNAVAGDPQGNSLEVRVVYESSEQSVYLPLIRK